MGQHGSIMKEHTDVFAKPHKLYGWQRRSVGPPLCYRLTPHIYLMSCHDIFKKDIDDPERINPDDIVDPVTFNAELLVG